MMTNERLKYSLLFALLGAVFFIPFLGGVHLFDWDEINFAEISREMMITNDYLRIYVNYLPFWEKPPFFFWLQSTAMEVFGVGEFAARLPNAVCGILTLVILFNIGKTLYNTRFGLIWAGVYFGSILPFLYFKSGIIDPFFNLFIFLGLYFFIRFYWKKENLAGLPEVSTPWLMLFLGGFFIGMGILTKGPVAFLIAGLTMFIYWIYQRFRLYISIPEFLFFTFAATLVMLAWYGLETLLHGPWFISEFNKYQYRLFSTPDAGHKGFPGYHFIVLLVGCFPASIFTLRSFARLPASEYSYQQDFRRWMKYLFWVVLILFTVVQSKIVHYSSMCYFPLTFLAAEVIYRIIEGKVHWARWMKITLAAIGGLYILATVALPFIGMQAEILQPLFDDPFARGNLEAEVRWTGWEVIPGLLLLGVLVFTFRLARRQQMRPAFLLLFGGTAIFVMLTLFFFIGRIEAYSQRAAIEFFESKAGEDVYIITHGYKSYAHLFYARKQPVANSDSYDKDWLIQGEIDKDVYVVTKVHKADELRAIGTLEEIGARNGFVFFRREARSGGE